jgi:methionyl-tRNA formyltransferase
MQENPSSVRKVVFLGAKSIGYFAFKHLLSKQAELNFRVTHAFISISPLSDKSEDFFELAASHGVLCLESIDDLLSIGEFDFLFSVQCDKILEAQHIACASRLAVNLHMAPLPEYRGCNQFSFAIYNGDREFGTTLHRLESGIDEGAILSERRFPIQEDETAQTLLKKCEIESRELFVESLGSIINEGYTLVPQSEFEHRESRFYYRRDIEDLKRIDLTQSVAEIDRRVRATTMPGFEPPYVVLGQMKYSIIPAVG